MADGTKRTSRDLGAASPDPKPARPASEVVRDPVHFSARKKGEGAQGPRCAQGKGTQGPRCANSEWRRGAFSGSCKVVAATASTRAGTFLPTVGKQQSRLGLAILTQVHVVTPSGCGCHCATPFLRRVRCRSGSQTLQKRQRLFPYCSLFSTFLRLSPRDALHRFTALSGHWPFAGDSEAPDWQPMALRDGTPEWADSLFLRKSSRPSFSISCSSVRVRRVP